MDEHLIQIRALRKQFGKLNVLNDVSLSVERGKVTAIIGPNASGKTTLLRSILGLVVPDSGVITVGGELVTKDCAYRRLIGYMPQTPSFPDNLTFDSLLKLLRSLRATSDYDEELISAFGLQALAAKELRFLSGGTKQKINAAIAFLFQPKLLIVDEPTAGLDPVSSIRLKEKIKQERQQGLTVLLTSHVLSEVDELADSIVYLVDGRVVYSGGLNALKEGLEETLLERAVAKMMMRRQAALC